MNLLNLTGQQGMYFQIVTITFVSDTIGSWMFPLFETTSSGKPVCKAAEQKCRQWAKDTVKIGGRLAKKLPPCPCNSGHAILDNTFRIEDNKTNYWDYYSVPQVCFVSRMVYSLTVYKNKKRLESEKEFHTVTQVIYYILKVSSYNI